MGTSKHSIRIPFAIVAVATIFSATARAEYRCAYPTQLAQEETRACRLAQQDTPRALIHFVNRTKAIYGLYLNDYVGKADVERWEMVKQEVGSGSSAVAKASGATKGDGMTD